MIIKIFKFQEFFSLFTFVILFNFFFGAEILYFLLPNFRTHYFQATICPLTTLLFSRLIGIYWQVSGGGGGASLETRLKFTLNSAKIRFCWLTSTHIYI